MEMFDDRKKSGPGRVVGTVERLVGRRRTWLVLVLSLVGAGLLIALGGSPAPSSNSGADLPTSAESNQVKQLRAQLPASKVAPAIVVFTRADGPLSAADRSTIEKVRERLAPSALGKKVAPPQVSKNKRAAILAVPLSASIPDAEVGKVITSLRATVHQDLPTGLDANVTGGPAFSADIGAIFDGADITLLAATALVVAILLLLTYRSPWLWLVPLIVVGLGDQSAAKIVAILSRTIGLQADGATTGITSVLVFGAGTNYALLLIARYREDLHREEDRYAAMRTALSSAAPAILASSSTVILALLSLGFAESPFTTAIGYAGAIGIAVAVLFALVVLPSALVLFPRGLFWPFTPRVGADSQKAGIWTRIGEAVVRRPVSVTVVIVLVLVVLALGSIGLHVGLSQNDQFRDKPEAVVGQEQLAANFSAGSAQPTIIITKTAQAATVLSAVEKVDGVDRAVRGDAGGSVTEIDATLASAPGTAASYTTVGRVRDAVHRVPGAQAKVGGPDAEDLDSRDAAARDRVVIIPIILAIVLLVLLVLLRSVVAAVLLVLTVVATYAASLGASWFMFSHWFGFPGMDLPVPLLGFLFLVALGIDYNIFLTTRAREETEHHTAIDGIVRALGATGGVITSAGIVLASVFAVLGVLPLITLTQVGVIVGFGVLLDTLLVRSLLVPALVALLGRRFWWPGRLSQDTSVVKESEPHSGSGSEGRSPSAANRGR